MKTDGQLYTRESEAPPSLAVSEDKNKGISIDKDILLVLGIILLITSEKHRADMPLVLALLYVLL